MGGISAGPLHLRASVEEGDVIRWPAQRLALLFESGGFTVTLQRAGLLVRLRLEHDRLGPALGLQLDALGESGGLGDLLLGQTLGLQDLLLRLEAHDLQIVFLLHGSIFGQHGVGVTVIKGLAEFNAGDLKALHVHPKQFLQGLGNARRDLLLKDLALFVD